MKLLPCSWTEEAVALNGIPDIYIEKIEEVSPPIGDRSLSVVERIDEAAMRLSVLTIQSSESSDTHGNCIRTHILNSSSLFDITHQYCIKLSSNIFLHLWFQDESEHSENANPNTIPSLNSSMGSQKSANVSKISRIGRPKGAKAMMWCDGVIVSCGSSYSR